MKKKITLAEWLKTKTKEELEGYLFADSYLAKEKKKLTGKTDKVFAKSIRLLEAELEKRN